MNTEQQKQMQSGKGFIAALDQSGGSTPKALKAYGIGEDRYQTEDEMFALMHQMRSRIMTNPVFESSRILAAILFERTMEEKVEGRFAADYLWEVKHIVPFLKVDKGLEEESEGVRLMKPIPSLAKLLAQAKKRHIFGTKMRSVILAANADGIRTLIRQQFEIGDVIMRAGLVPILEPEVDIYSADKEHSEILLKKYIKEELAALPDSARIMLKLSIPSVDGFYGELMRDAHVVRVVALSGGYTRTEANARLAKNPGLIASFSRALSEGLVESLSDEDYTAHLQEAVASIYEASIAGGPELQP